MSPSEGKSRQPLLLTERPCQYSEHFNQPACSAGFRIVSLIDTNPNAHTQKHTRTVLKHRPLMAFGQWPSIAQNPFHPQDAPPILWLRPIPCASIWSSRLATLDFHSGKQLSFQYLFDLPVCFHWISRAWLSFQSYVIVSQRLYDMLCFSNKEQKRQRHKSSI